MTAITQIPIRCARQTTDWLCVHRRARWGWAIWARSARTAQPFIMRSARMRARGIDALYALGEASRGACAAFGAGAHAFDDAAALVEHLLRAGLDARATILVKGSRFMKMERVVNALTDPLHTRTGN